jgi:hypothetical protein
MAKLTPAGQDIVDQLQKLADQMGHLPTQAEFEASEMAKSVPIFRINGLLHGFDKAMKHLTDPAVRDLSAPDAIAMACDFALRNRELLTKTAWARAIRAGEELPPHERLVEASGRTANQLEFLSHQVLVDDGYEPTGAARTNYTKVKPPSHTEREASGKANALRGTRAAPEADDAAVREMAAEERQARKDAGVRQGRIQTSADKAGSEDWLGL